MKPNPLVQRLTDSLPPPTPGPTVSAHVKRIVEAGKKKKSKKKEPTESDSEVKDEVFPIYQSDWRYTAIDQFNAEQSENLSVTDDESKLDGEDPDYMRFDDWYIYRNEETAERDAYNQVLQELEDEPEIFNQEWLSNFIDKANLKHLLWQDVAEHRRSDFDEMQQRDKIGELERAGLIDDTDIYVVTKVVSRRYQYPSDDQETAISAYLAANPSADADRLQAMDDEDLVKLLVSAGIIAEEDAYEESQVEREDLDEFIDSKADDYVDSLEKDFDPMEWLEDIYGKEDALKQAIEIAGLNKEEAAKNAISTDGWGNYLARGEPTSELQCGAVYFKL